MPRPASSTSSVGAASEFSCKDCGSPSVVVPAPLSARGAVSCGGCGRYLATWTQFCRRVNRLLSAPARVPAGLPHRPVPSREALVGDLGAP